MLSGKREEGGKKEEHGVHEVEGKNEGRVSCARDLAGGARLFISEKGCKDCSRATTPSAPHTQFPANSRPYYQRHNNKVNALQIKRTRKTFRVALCPF